MGILRVNYGYRRPFVRRLSVVVAALILTIALALTSSPSLAAPKSATSISISATTTVEKGKSATFKGSLKKSKKAVAKATVRIQHLSGKTWKTVKTAKTSSKGAYKASVKVSTTGKYRAWYSGSSKLKASKSATKTVTVGYSPKLTNVKVAGGSSADSGQTKTVTGNLQKQLSGVNVQLQRKDKSKWTTLAKAKVSSKGTFKTSARITGGGKVTLRIYVSKQTKTTKAVSKQLTLTVWRWRNLSDMDTKDRYYSSAGSYNVNGTNYPDSIEIWGSIGYRTFDLGRKCSTFRSTVGIEDRNTSDRRATARIDVDGTRIKTENIKWGTSRNYNIDISGALELKLAVSKYSNAEFGSLVYGDAQVRCSS